MTRPDDQPKTSTRQLSWRIKFLIVVGVVVAVPVLLFRLRYCRTVVLRDLSAMRTKTVTVNPRAGSMSWSVAGNVQGTGTLTISYVYSNTVSGKFATNGSGDYYDTNVTVTFVPNGATKGKLRASFYLPEF